MKDKLYFPILKGKAGEFQAIEDLSAKNKKLIAPILEITDVPWDFQNETYAKSPDKHLENFGEKIAKSLKGMSFYVDLPESLWEEELDQGFHPIAKIFEVIRQKELYAIPITGADRPSEYQDVVKSIIETDKRGLCLRLPLERLNLEHINGLLSIFSIKPEEADLLIDVGSIDPTSDTYLGIALQSVITTLPYKSEWRNIIFAATAFPKDLRDVDAGTTSLPRTEWKTWSKLHQSNETKDVKFADYAISHPEIVVMDPRVITMSANIRYTTKDDWLIFKGRGVKKHGYSQFTELCQSLIASGNYSGEEFSAGDRIIKECSTKKLGPGNATVWRKVGVNHHLTFVCNQLSNLS